MACCAQYKSELRRTRDELRVARDQLAIRGRHVRGITARNQQLRQLPNAHSKNGQQPQDASPPVQVNNLRDGLSQVNVKGSHRAAQRAPHAPSPALSPAPIAHAHAPIAPAPAPIAPAPAPIAHAHATIPARTESLSGAGAVPSNDSKRHAKKSHNKAPTLHQSNVDVLSDDQLQFSGTPAAVMHLALQVIGALFVLVVMMQD